MHSGQAAIIATLVIAVGLGTYSFIAIKQTAGRRTALVDLAAQHMPAIPGGRVVAAWEPATYADDVRASYCFDDTDPETVYGRVLNAFLAAGWTQGELKRDAASSTILMSFSGPLHLRLGIAPGSNPGCNTSKRQIALGLDVSR